MDEQDDFEHQLALEQEETRKQEQGHIYTDPNDGTVYEWDEEKKAWFPRVDDNFLAAYHANYGMYPTQEGEQTTSATQPSTTAPAPAINTEKPKPKKAKQGSGEEVSVEESLMRAQREAELGIPAPVLDEKIAAADAEHQKSLKRKKEEPTWFEMEEAKNTNVYVSGLPTESFTEADFIELMSKCGIIMVDEENNDAPKVKLYRDENGYLKGDGRCCYLKVESVNLAIQLLDDSQLQGKKIHVERAKFTMKGNFNPGLKRKKKKPKKKKKTNFTEQDKLLDWRPEKSFQKKRFEQVMIIKHVFHPDDFEEDAMLINEIKDDLEAECKKFGEVKKVMIFDRHPDGVASVKFKDGNDADVCVLALNGRWFAKRQLVAEIWDGKTDYKVEETDKERDERLKKWSEFLENDEDKEKTTEDKTQNQDNDDKEKTTEDKNNTESQDIDNEEKESATPNTSEAEAESRVGELTEKKSDATSESVSNSDVVMKTEDTDEKMPTDRTDESKKESNEVGKEADTREETTEEPPS